MPAYSLIIRGKVQGVCFRAYTQESAQGLGVVGWVRNRPDGSVEALLQHKDHVVLQQLTRQLAQGPPSAVVSAVELEIAQEDSSLSGFAILR